MRGPARIFWANLTTFSLKLFDFGIGETNPEIPVPDIIKATIASATMAEENHYSAAQGDPALLQAREIHRVAP